MSLVHVLKFKHDIVTKNYKLQKLLIQECKPLNIASYRVANLMNNANVFQNIVIIITLPTWVSYYILAALDTVLIEYNRHIILIIMHPCFSIKLKF